MQHLFLSMMLLTTAFIAKSQPTSIDQVTKAMMPLPKQIVLNDGSFKVDRSFSVKINAPENGRMLEYAQRFIHRLDEQTCLFLSPDMVLSNEKVTIQYARIGNLKVGENESYQLKVDEQHIQIIAETDLGAMHALETLLQLLDANANGFFIPAVQITDEPRFTWRGLMIDVARHFQPMEVIKRNIDGMAMVKLNVLHLHLSDDQGFRVESKKYPLLQQLGSDGQYFTQLQIKELIQYANDRGIRVVPEFDMPAHTTAWYVGYPFLASAPGPYQIEREMGVFDPAMNPTNERTYQFLDTLLTEMCQLFNDDYFHIGGDECNGNQWNANKDIQAFMKTNNMNSNHELQAYLNLHLNQILKNNNKIMMGWEEIKNPELPKDIMVHAWRGPETLLEAVKEGYHVILSRGFYIDLMYPASVHYKVDPVPVSGLTDEQKKLILGGEATMWSEFVTPENIDSRIWPRTAAIAERFWSPAKVTDENSMYNRLGKISLQLEWAGLKNESYYPVMLRRLTRGENIEPLQTLTDVCEALEEYNRDPNFRESTGLAFKENLPFARVMDAVKPESDVARKFNQKAAEYIANPSQAKADELIAQLIIWKTNHDKLKIIIGNAPALKEIESLSEDLSKTAEIGITAIQNLQSKTKLSKESVKQSKETLQKAREPRGQVTLMIIDGIELLLSKAE